MDPPLLPQRFEPLPGNHTYLVPVKLLEVEQKNGGGGKAGRRMPGVGRALLGR